MKFVSFSLCALGATLTLASLAPDSLAQQRPPRPTETPKLGGQTLGTPPATPPKPGPKPYKEVVTAEAKTDKGMFTVHRIEDKLLFEIPPEMLGRDMLLSIEVAKLPTGFGYGGTAVGDKVIRWTRRNNKIFVRLVDFSARADGKTAIQKAVDAANVDSIIQSFDIEAEGENKSAVIDVTRLFTTDPPEFSAKSALGASGADPSRSYLDRVKAFPKNVETRSYITYSVGPPSFNPFSGRLSHPNVSSATALIHYSIALLPDKPMMGRLFDDRVGYFTEGFQDYGTDENRVKDREYVTRYRLEKKDPNAAVSEPVKPIVYYISREVPEKWRDYMMKGVEMWQPAFEQAGFKNAIIAKLAPTEKEDPDWDPEDARYSVIRWAPLPIANAMGPNVHDPRSGEIISAHVIFWHDVLKLAQAWYFVQCAPLDPRAQKLPMPESVIGPLLQIITAHEVGHTLGLRHNHKASSSFTIAQLRDKAFTEKWGVEASIMDYGRFNYVAQPGDNAYLLPKIGPYDLFAIEWGYKPVSSASTPSGEERFLDEIAARQTTDPMLRFGGEDLVAQFDPTVQTEDLGSDPIEATTMGLKNLNRVAGLLMPATTKLGEDYSLLEEVYGEMWGQRQRELFHVAKLVGGVAEIRYHAGRGKEPFQPVPKAKQQEAVRFLLENGLKVPPSFVAPSLVNRIQPSGVADRVLANQLSIVRTLLSDVRAKRLVDAQILSTAPTYTVAELVTDVQNGVWSELTGVKPTIDIYRRNLQRGYVQMMKPMLTGDTASQTELRPTAMGALRDLAMKIDKTLPKVTDPATRLHLIDCRANIERIINPKT